jgi:hypothetical protein
MPGKPTEPQKRRTPPKKGKKITRTTFFFAILKRTCRRIQVCSLACPLTCGSMYSMHTCSCTIRAVNTYVTIPFQWISIIFF